MNLGSNMSNMSKQYKIDNIVDEKPELSLEKKREILLEIETFLFTILNEKNLYLGSISYLNNFEIKDNIHKTQSKLQMVFHGIKQ